MYIFLATFLAFIAGFLYRYFADWIVGPPPSLDTQAKLAILRQPEPYEITVIREKLNEFVDPDLLDSPRCKDGDMLIVAHNEYIRVQVKKYEENYRPS